MDIPQVAYENTMPVGIAGMVAQTGQHVDSFLAGEDIAFGLGVVTDDPDTDTVILPNGGAIADRTFRGFTIYNASQAANAAEGYLEKQAVSVLRRGRIWLEAQGDVVSDGEIFVIDTGADAGKIRGDNTDATLIGSCVCLKGALAGALALVEINLP